MTKEINVIAQTELLIKLQDIDTQIYRLRAEKEQKPQEMAELKASLEQKRSGMKNAEENLKTIQLKHREKEVELSTKEEAVKKLQAQLNQIKTNKEYTAMINEIEGHKADNSLLEEEIIKLMDSIDQAKSELEKEKQKFSEESKNIDGQIREVEKQVKDIDASIAELKKSREALTPQIDKKLLGEYERILEGRSGQALVEVVNDACGGCYMQLPPQVINEIRMKQKVIFCENCQRMLYIKDEEESG